MSTWDKMYTDRFQLLVDNLPTLAKETRFALKGDTGINHFEHGLARDALSYLLAASANTRF